MDITFLTASIPLTKTYELTAKGLTKTTYPHVYEFSSYTHSISNLGDLKTLLDQHATSGACMLKGNTSRVLVNESRAGSTDSNASTQLLVLDIDGLPTGTTPEDVMKAINASNVSYIVQYSASHGIESNHLRCHIYIWLDRTYSAPLLKQYLIALNHHVSLLSGCMSLTKSGMAISWGLDITACQNDKLIYITPPNLINVNDPFKGKHRIELIKKKFTEHSLPLIPSTEVNKEVTVKKINELRVAAGLPKRKPTYKTLGSNQVELKPDVCTITEMKRERGFTYFNLNGGDSWAYYHPENNPKFIYNFKGENTYLTSELLPDYWAQQTTTVTGTVKTTLSDATYIAFMDRKTASYWKGEFQEDSNSLDLYPARSETQVRHFARQHGLPLGDFIPEWDLIFDPMSHTRIDHKNRVVNVFEPSEYMKQKSRKVLVCPKLIYRIIHHALGEDSRITDYFLNWLAFCLQFKDRSLTAWTLHGRTGTGKGVLFKHILRPLFGPKQATMRRMGEFAEKYNSYMRDHLIIVVDEIQTSSLRDEEGVMADLRNFITESPITVRAMYSGSAEYDNRANFLFFSNKPDPIQITRDDRRINVAKFQTKRLILTDDELYKDLPKELQTFHDYLMTRVVNKHDAQHVLETEDRKLLQSISELSIDTVAEALLSGQFAFFIDGLPARPTSNPAEAFREGEYKRVLVSLLNRSDNAGNCSITREELRTLFDFMVGDIPKTPNKLTSLLKHHRIHMKKVWVDSSVAGIKITWSDVRQWPTYRNLLTPGTAKPVLKQVGVPA